MLGAEAKEPGNRAKGSDLATFIYTGGTTGPSKGCMLTHNYHGALARQIGLCWGRTSDDVAWTPLPLYHFNALTTVVIGTLLYGGRGAIYRKFSVSNFWSEMNRVGATITSTLGSMTYLLANDIDRPEMPLSGQPEANRSLRLIGAVPMPPEVDDVIRNRFGVTTFSGAYGVTEASLISWQPPGTRNKAGAAGVVNDEYFDVRIFDDDDGELPANAEGEIVVRPKRAHVMFEGYWGRPDVTVETSRNWWYHTGDIGRIDEDRYLYFVDRKADYLRRRGENISSFEVESVLMSHGGAGRRRRPCRAESAQRGRPEGDGGDQGQPGVVGTKSSSSGARLSCRTLHSPATSNSETTCHGAPSGESSNVNSAKRA